MRCFQIAIWVLLVSSNGLSAEPSPTPDAPSDSYVCDTRWPGVKLKIVAVKRLDVQNIVIALHVDAGTDSPVSTFIGYWSDDDKPGPVTLKHHPLPYSLLKASVMDLATKQVYGAVEQPLSNKGYGVSEIITGMHPGEWFQMAVQFRLPVPAPNPDRTIPVQKVDVTFPPAKGPIKGVVVPPL